MSSGSRAYCSGGFRPCGGRGAAPSSRMFRMTASPSAPLSSGCGSTPGKPPGPVPPPCMSDRSISASPASRGLPARRCCTASGSAACRRPRKTAFTRSVSASFSPPGRIGPRPVEGPLNTSTWMGSTGRHLLSRQDIQSASRQWPLTGPGLLRAPPGSASGRSRCGSPMVMILPSRSPRFRRVRAKARRVRRDPPGQHHRAVQIHSAGMLRTRHSYSPARPMACSRRRPARQRRDMVQAHRRLRPVLAPAARGRVASPSANRPHCPSSASAIPSASQYSRCLRCGAPNPAAQVSAAPTAYPSPSRSADTRSNHSRPPRELTCSPRTGTAGGLPASNNAKNTGQRWRLSSTPSRFPAVEKGWQGREAVQTGLSSSQPPLLRARLQAPIPAKKWHCVNPRTSCDVASSTPRSSTTPSAISPVRTSSRSHAAAAGSFSL